MDSGSLIIFVLTIIAGSGLVLIYLGYPMFLIFSQKQNPTYAQINEHGSLSLIIPSWQDPADLLDKIDNTTQLNLSGIDLEVVVITDQDMPGVLALTKLPFQLTWIKQTERVGKAASLNQAMEQSSRSIVVFSDANTRLSQDALQQILLPFCDQRIGAVAGEKRVVSDHRSTAGTEQLYWKYESVLKRLDARMHSAIGGAGELFAMRTKLFEALPEDCLLDDLELSWQIIKKGYRIAYAPNAIATEAPSMDINQEAKRKVRIASGGYQFMDRHPIYSLFKPSAAYGLLFLVRKWSRWVLAPLFLLMSLIGNVALILLLSDDPWVQLMTWLQGGFYLLAVIGWVLLSARFRIGWLAAPFYFLFMHYCQLRGWIRYRFGKQSVIWEKSERIPSA